MRALRAQPRLGDFTISEQRAIYQEVTAKFPVPDDVVCEPVLAGGITAEWITPAYAPDDAVILYLHGGGYAIGSIATDRPLAARLALSAGIRALAIDYRLAPEHPFPAAIDDAVTAFRWLMSSGLSPERTVIAGISGGGGLTMATLLALRDGGGPLPCAAVCMSPWLDVTCESVSASANIDADPVATPAWLRTLAQAYLNGAAARTPLASPLFADPAGLPPLLIQVGAAEILLDEGRAFARRALAAGVDVTLDAWQDVFHFWQGYAHALPEGQAAIERCGAFIRRHVAAPAPG